MKEKMIDLHTHTCYSDGEYTTDKRRKSDIPLVSKAPKVIFTNKISDDARRNN